MIINDTVELESLKKNGNRCYPERIKFCIDRKRKVVAIDEEMHIDMEHELYDDGSDYGDIFGGDIMISGEKPYIVWEAHPNIQRNREMGIGAGRKLTDTALIDELKEILVSRVK